jgi:glycosyltransferase involved in cell wall biosynthesis
MKLISVITPSFNQGRFIERTLCSVLDQNIPNLEYVIFDAGSTDETLSILERYQDRIRWSSEPDRGQTHAVNKGISATSGDIIAWINSDDVYYPGALGTIQAYFTEHPDVDVIYGNAFHIDEEGHEIEAYYTEPWSFSRLKEVCFLCQPAVFFRRRMIERFGLLNESLHFCMDYEFWLRMAIGGASFAYLPIPLAGSRMYAQNKTLSQRVRFHAEINGMMKEKFNQVPDAWLYNYAHAVVDARDISRGTRKFALTVAWESLFASLRWNHSLSKEMLRTTAGWAGLVKLS